MAVHEIMQIQAKSISMNHTMRGKQYVITVTLIVALMSDGLVFIYFCRFSHIEHL